MRRSLDGCRVIVTGASSGIGRAVAVGLAKKGASVMVNARREVRLRQLTEKIAQAGGSAAYYAGDMTKEADRQRLIDTACQELGGLDSLINNAGLGGIGTFAAADPSRIRQIMELNFFAPVELTRLALPRLRKGRSPIIVNIGSVLGHFAVPRKSEYCASKFALHGFSDALRAELAAEGIDVLLISPSTTATEFFDSAIADKSRQGKIASRTMPPESVANRVIRAMELGKREVILSAGGRLMVWIDRLFPGISAKLVARFE